MIVSLAYETQDKHLSHTRPVPHAAVCALGYRKCWDVRFGVAGICSCLCLAECLQSVSAPQRAARQRGVEGEAVMEVGTSLTKSRIRSSL